MLGYYLYLALRSLRQNVALTTLMVAAVAVGIGASMTTLSIFRLVSGDPIPAKSERLFVPQIDNYGPTSAESTLSTEDRLPPALTYIDAAALMHARMAERQTAMFPTAGAIDAPDSEQLPVRVYGHATYADFFAMFDVPFEYGAPWSAADDAAAARVIVLSRQLNDELFNGIDSVGRTVRLNNGEYRVAGVIQDWYPIPPFYDAGSIDSWGPDKMFLPFTTALAQNLPKGGPTNCPNARGEVREDTVLQSECDWVGVWVELPNAAAARSYRKFLTNYAAEQRQIGRFKWAPRIALRNVRQWLEYKDVVPNELSVLVLLSLAFLLVCALNGVALMLAKFMAYSGQAQIRRAMGGSTFAIFAQVFTEAGVIGLLGGVLGIGLSVLGLRVARGLFSQSVAASLTRLDGADILIALSLSVGATLLVALYPTWRVTHRQSSAWPSKVGPALITLQIALTLAILCNAVFIVQQNLTKVFQSSGIDERNDFAVSNYWIGNQADLISSIQSDVLALRSIPSVRDAYQSNVLPFLGGQTVGITLHPDRAGSTETAAVYFGDQHAVDTLGLKLVAGRNFRAAEISDYDGRRDQPAASGVLVTWALAQQLAPGGRVLGHLATLTPSNISVPVVGVIGALQIPFAYAPEVDSFAENSIVLPYRYINSYGFYIVRAKPGRLAEAMRAAPVALAGVSRQRVAVVQSLSGQRLEGYRGDRTVALMLSTICLILLAVTAFGIVGLTSYWVSQRRYQIGIRRALGATRLGIIRHFLIENLVIMACGILIGVLVAVAGNLWIVRSYSTSRLPFEYLLIGAVAVLALGQLAALWPALRAASVPPAEATRTI